MGRNKTVEPFGPKGCILGMLFLPFQVLGELVKKYGGKRR